MLLLDLENIERIMLEKYNEKLKVRVKATTALADGKGKQKKGTSGKGSSDRVPKKAHAKSFANYAKLTAGLTRCTTHANAVVTTRIEEALQTAWGQKWPCLYDSDA